MLFSKNLQLPAPDNYLRNSQGLKISPELVLINLDKLQQQLASGDFVPAEYLGQDELATFRQFKYQKRQFEWLGGRLAAKHSVLRLHGQELSARAMCKWEICADEHGKPFFKSLRGNQQPALSISHSHGLALALTLNEKGCGVDIQKISEATVRVKEKFCSQTEERLISYLGLPDNNPAIALTLLWAAKEALRKARGGHPLTGFTAMKMIETVRANTNSWLLTMMINNERYQIQTFFYKDFAIALSVI